MNHVGRRAARGRTLRGVCLALAALLAFAPAPARQDEAARAPSREEAYRANNLGVALLEQFKHREGAEQFRRALAADPALALARINLAIALYNVPDIEAARKEAEVAASAAPDSPQPHYLLGLIARQQNRAEDALASFGRVLRIDARDVGANVQLGQLLSQGRKYEEAVEVFRVALAEEPYNGTALYNLGTALLRAGRREEGQAAMSRFQELRQSGAATVIGQNYLEQGRYAEAVGSTGAEADLVDKRTPDVTFADATATTLPRAAATGRKIPPARGAQPALSLRRSLPGVVTLFDYDGDLDLDLFTLAGAEPRLYRNDQGKFTDATARSGGLAQAGAAGGGIAIAGDFDNDERPDLFIFGAGTLSLYRNEGGGRFSDVTARAKIPGYAHLSASAAFVDCDHDGDLDIFVAGLADLSKPLPRGGAEKASGAASFSPEFAPAPNLLLRNNGDGTFADITAQAKVAGGTAHAVAVVPTDYDNRRDVDLLVVNLGARPALFRNLRDGSFRDVATEVGLGVAGNFTAAAAGDFNKDGFTDFYFAAQKSPGLFAASDGRGRFKTTAAPAAIDGGTAAQFFDYDCDGLLDLLVASPAGLRVLRNVGDGWADASDRAARGLAAARPPLVPRLLASADLDGDGDTDLVARDDDGALKFLRNDGGNKNASVRVSLAGKVSNRGGAGAKVELRAGSLQQKLETYSAAPAPAPADVLFGLGRRASAEAVRVVWPSGVVQAETGSATREGAQGSTARVEPGTLKVQELDRKPSSCPFLYAWNGERFEFITDFMGGGELGYWHAPGVYSSPDPDEYVRIRGDQLRARDGRYELRVTNELEEVLFVDRLQLVAVSHPANVEVFPNEGLGNPTAPAFKLYATRGARPPRSARDERGRDVLARLARLDRTYPDDFTLTPIRGYAEDHALTLDLGKNEGGARRDERTRAKDEVKTSGANVKASGADVSTSGANDRALITHHSSLITEQRILLLLTGWTDYAFSSDNVAAHQRGLALRPPSLQVKDGAGRWQTVIESMGFPVGRPQTVTVDLTGKFLSASREVRIVTNMRVYWDQILVDDSGADSSVLPRVERLEAAAANLRERGFSALVTPDGREPFDYDYARVSAESPWKVFTGRYTRLGDVRELLTGTDDMFVVSRPGDEVALSFDARALAPLPAGWARTFLLYADGYSKEMDINSASPHEVAPLPFHAMRGYPYAAPEAYPADEAHRSYLERYNTRVVAAPLSRLLAGVR